jgi:hypothetical protein
MPWPDWLGFSYAIMTSWTLGFLEKFRGFLCGFTKVMRAWKTPKKLQKDHHKRQLSCYNSIVDIAFNIWLLRIH